MPVLISTDNRIRDDEKAFYYEGFKYNCFNLPASCLKIVSESKKEYTVQGNIIIIKHRCLSDLVPGSLLSKTFRCIWDLNLKSIAVPCMDETAIKYYCFRFEQEFADVNVRLIVNKEQMDYILNNTQRLFQIKHLEKMVL